MKDSMNLSQEDHDTLSTRQERRLTVCCCAHSCRLRASCLFMSSSLMVYLVSLLMSSLVMIKFLLFYVAIFVVIFCIWRCTLYTECTYDRAVQHSRGATRTRPGGALPGGVTRVSHGGATRTRHPSSGSGSARRAPTLVIVGQTSARFTSPSPP